MQGYKLSSDLAVGSVKQIRELTASLNHKDLSFQSYSNRKFLLCSYSRPPFLTNSENLVIVVFSIWECSVR